MRANCIVSSRWCCSLCYSCGFLGLLLSLLFSLSLSSLLVQPLLQLHFSSSRTIAAAFHRPHQRKQHSQFILAQKSLSATTTRSIPFLSVSSKPTLCMLQDQPYNGQSIPTPSVQPSLLFPQNKTSIFQRKQQQQQKQQPLLFWLDLRGTALSPQEALQFLHNQLYIVTKKKKYDTDNDDMETTTASSNTNDDVKQMVIIDGILLSQNMFENISKIESQFLADQWNITLLCEIETTNELIANSVAAQMSLPVGTIIKYNNNHEIDSKATTTIDLLLAYDVVMEQEKWLVLDPIHPASDLEQHSRQRTPQQGPVANLLRILSSLRKDQSIAGTGLTLPNNHNKPQASSSSSSGIDSKSTGAIGGIAIVCRDPNTLLMMDSILAEYRSYVHGNTITTESGLLITTEYHSVPTSNSNSNSSSARYDKVQSERFQSPATALVIPLELGIWQRVLLLQQMKVDD